MNKDRAARIISGKGGLSFSLTLMSVFVSMSIILDYNIRVLRFLTPIFNCHTIVTGSSRPIYNRIVKVSISLCNFPAV